MSEQRTPEELAAAYAIGALGDAERAEYEAWLLQSPDAAADAASFADVASTLGLAAQPVAPSGDLRSRLLAQVASTPQLAPTAPAEPPAPVEPVETKPPAETPTPAEHRARSRWSRGPALLVAAAAAIILFVGGGVAGSLIAQNNFEVEQATALAELQAASDAQQAVTEMEGGGQVTMIWSAEQRRSAVMIDDMPPLPDGQTYQFWYIGEDGPVPDATFEAAESGKTWRVLDGEMSGGEAVGITVEPEGGSPEPTTDPVVVIESA